MNLEGYVLEIIKKIEEKGFLAYIAGRAVFLHSIGRPIEEYDIITSSPFFSLTKKEKRTENEVYIEEYRKRIHISFSLNKEEYYRYCCFSLDSILYHYRHGIIDENYALEDIEKKKIKILNIESLNQENILRAIFYETSYNFRLEKKLEEYILKYSDSFSNGNEKTIGSHLIKILSLPEPGKIILKYHNIFSLCFNISDTLVKILDYTKNDLLLRLFVIYKDTDIILNLPHLKQYGIPKRIRDQLLRMIEVGDISYSTNSLKELVSKVSIKEAKILISYQRAFFLASHQLDEIEKWDTFEKKLDSLYKKTE